MTKFNAQALAYAHGICKAAEAMGIDPRAITRGTIAKTAMEKRAFTAVELATVLGLTGLGMYGGYKGLNALTARNNAQQAAASAAEAGKPVVPGEYSAANKGLETAGKYTTIGGAAALGGLLGRRVGKLRGTRGGGLKGMALGGALGGITHLFGGGLSRFAGGKRTGSQQYEHDSSLKLRNLLPGVAGYNAGRRPEAKA